jgi:GNAT superfamily N-acetyltransferase
MIHALRRFLGVEVYYLFVRRLGARPPLVRAPSGLRFALLAEPDLLPYCGDPGLDLREASVRAACGAGQTCLGAFDGARLAGYVWHAFAGAPHVGGTRVDFGPGVRYTYKLWVHPDYRGRGLGRELIARSEELCPAHERRLGFSFVAPDNRASLRAFAAAGWRRAGCAVYIRWLGHTFASAGAARLGARFARA